MIFEPVRTLPVIFHVRCKTLHDHAWSCMIVRKSCMILARFSMILCKMACKIFFPWEKRETMSQPILILGEKQARRLSSATPTHARSSSGAREDPPLQVAGEQLPQRPLLPLLPCPYPSRHEVIRGKHAHFDKLTSPIDDPSSLPV